MYKYSIALVLILISATFTFAGSPALEGIITAYQQLEIAGSSGDAEGVMMARGTFERITSDNEYGWLAHYYVGLASYRKLNIDYDKMDNKQRANLLDDAIKNMKKSLKMKKNWSEALALQGSCYGRLAGVKPVTAMITGPKSGKIMDKAMKADNTNPRLYLLQGIGFYNRPEEYGGDKEEAFRLYNEAIKYFKEENIDPQSGLPDWGYEEAWTWIGIYHKDKGDMEKARAAFEKALEINPEYGWAKYVLLPQVSGATEKSEGQDKI